MTSRFLMCQPQYFDVSHAERQTEERHFERWFARHGFEVHRLACEIPHEGGGDAGAFSESSQRLLRGVIPWEQSILVGEEDAEKFACNAVNIGDQVILNGASESLVAALSRAGFQPEQSPLSEFLRAGGASKCLTLRLEEAV
jgi:N-dimethylarginine dimethylaminohydrolase